MTGPCTSKPWVGDIIVEFSKPPFSKAAITTAFSILIQRPSLPCPQKTPRTQVVHPVQESGTKLLSVNSSHRTYSGDGKKIQPTTCTLDVRHYTSSANHSSFSKWPPKWDGLDKWSAKTSSNLNRGPGMELTQLAASYIREDLAKARESRVHPVTDGRCRCRADMDINVVSPWNRNTFSPTCFDMIASHCLIFVQVDVNLY